eukprot:4357007-Ditylum_brightwellii.AAC.1
MEYVKLEMNYDDRTKKTRKCQRFLGKEEIEGAEFFDNWLEVLVDTAEDKWTTQVSGIANIDFMIPRFNAKIKKFYRKYCDAEAKDTVFEYLATLRRLTKVTLQDHSD